MQIVILLLSKADNDETSILGAINALDPISRVHLRLIAQLELCNGSLRDHEVLTNRD